MNRVTFVVCTLRREGGDEWETRFRGGPKALREWLGEHYQNPAEALKTGEFRLYVRTAPDALRRLREIPPTL